MKGKKLRVSEWQVLALGYLIVILIGSILLIVPYATADGQKTDYLNALFTSVSATCVTGLVPYDTGTHWSLYGQIVILLLIQTGGLGFMTFVSSVLMMLGKGMRMGGRIALMASSGARKQSGITSLVKRITLGTLIFEVAGALLLSIRFIPMFGAARGVWFSIFHSVTAFCNAGFDLMGSVGVASLTAFAFDPLVNITICCLIILGGLGFCVWGDVLDCRFHFGKFQLNTKTVLTVSGVILAVSTALFMVFEWNNPYLAGRNFGEKLLVALFNATSPRTAGFYAMEPAYLSDSGYLLTIVLMFIGGGTGSTAGGIKVGTFAVIMMGMFGVFRGNRDINIGKKRIEYSLLSQALAIFAACLMLVILATLSVCAIEGGDDISFKEILFECVSALGTVGLTLGGTTAKLAAASKVIIMLLMYAGRAGILTLAFAVAKKRKASEIRKPIDTLLIG